MHSKPWTRSARTWTVALALLALPAAAQTEVGGREVIDSDRPEAWAMERSASLTLFTALDVPRARDAGAFALGLELGWNPTLSDDARRVGFNGTKVEDVNRLAVIPRVRATVGIGKGIGLDLSYTPPLHLNGLEPNLLAAALERPVWTGRAWTLGLRAYGQRGRVRGDITCPEAETEIPAGAPGNEFGCQARSRDEVTIDYWGLGVIGGVHLPGGHDQAIHFGLYVNRMDLEFQVDAFTFDVHDRTLLVARTTTWAFTTGYSIAVTEPLRFAIEGFYTPLDVVRPPATEPVGADLYNLRAMLVYRFR